MFTLIIILNGRPVDWEPLRRFAVKALKWMAAGYIIALHVILMGF